MKTVRVGAGSAFYGDSPRPAIEMAKKADVQYICFDALAELTMAILQKDRAKNPAMGYARDVVPLMKGILAPAMERGIRLITNAGALNPDAAAAAVAEVARAQGIKGLKIGVVNGDDLFPRLDELTAQGVEFKDMDTGRPLADVREKLSFASAYVGSWPIAKALAMGAHVVITGRTTDTAQFLAPLMYEFGWKDGDWDLLAAGITAGHIMECGSQAAGGNFSGQWWTVPDRWHYAMPICEMDENGEFTITKLEGTGGMVHSDTVKEQLLYEIHNPAAYITPDVVADYMNIRLTDVGPNRVRVTGSKGHPAPPTLKVIMGYADGWAAEGRMTYSYPDAYPKAKEAAATLRRVLDEIGFPALEHHVEFIGVNSIHGPLAPEPTYEPNEVQMRYVARTARYEDAAKLGREIAPLGMAGPPHVSGVGGMMAPRELLGIWSALVARHIVEDNIRIRIEEV